ncbi:UNVERIFIED_CONTAM: Dscam2 [Trichonephila clavipes]
MLFMLLLLELTGVVLSSSEYDTWKIQPFVFPPSLTVGTRASTVCSTSKGTGLQFQWLRNGKRLDQSTNIQIRSYTDSSMILIESLSEEDSGNYTCIVKSDRKTDSFTAVLVVLVPPSWIQRPTDKDVLAGDLVLIPCSVSGKPDPVLQWSFSGLEDSIYTNVIASETFIVHPNGSLFLKNIKKSHEGLYKCNASNGVGGSLEATMSLRL